MREPILKAVASPPKVLWAPMLPALMNLGLQFPVMFTVMGAYSVNPLLFVTTILLGHLAIISWGVKEPHASNMIQAFGQTYRVTNNLYKTKGNKFAP